MTWKEYLYWFFETYSGKRSHYGWQLPILLCLLVFLLCGCSPKVVTVTVPEYHTDTLRITKHQRDSIWLHDSTVVHDGGDTVMIEKWHTKYIDKQVHDTVYQSRTDSVAVPYPVPAQLSRWQSFCCEYGKIMVGFSVASIIIFVMLVIYWVRKFL